MTATYSKEGCEKYYEYIFTYADDCLFISEETKWLLDVLKCEPYTYVLKDVGPPSRYLGAKCGKYNLGDSEA